ncbi:MAG: zinc-binding dehydrogenase [Phycisphaerales bacterium]|nr:zinc-binding dehydrogenase [Phycisphaerales bacterium]
MRALVITGQTPTDKAVADSVRLQNDWPEPGPPEHGEVMVRTLASALNHLDLWVGHGVPGLNLTYPRVSGSDACGVVEAIGPGVDGSWIGKRVILNAASDVSPLPRPGDAPGGSLSPQYELIGEHHHGTMAERFVAPVTGLAIVGDDRDPVESAAFGLTFLTAYSMMVGKAGLRPGQPVLVTGIGGGVALAALAIARHMGCPVAVTSRHQWKLDRAKELGASLGVLDTGDDWSKPVRAWTGGRGVNLAVDSSGKATHIKCIKSLARGGAYVTPGCTSGHDATTDLARIFWNQLRILGSTMGSSAEFGEIAALYRERKIGPVVDQVFAAEEGAKAYARLESAEQFGKVVVRW